MQQLVEETLNSGDSGRRLNTSLSSDGKVDGLQVTVTQHDAVEEETSHPGHADDLESTDATQMVDAANATETNKTSTTGNASDTANEPKYEGAEMSKEELLKHRRSNLPTV